MVSRTRYVLTLAFSTKLARRSLTQSSSGASRRYQHRPASPSYNSSRLLNENRQLRYGTRRRLSLRNELNRYWICGVRDRRRRRLGAMRFRRGQYHPGQLGGPCSRTKLCRGGPPTMGMVRRKDQTRAAGRRRLDGPLESKNRCARQHRSRDIW